jgi:hypothetical protein
MTRRHADADYATSQPFSTIIFAEFSLIDMMLKMSAACRQHADAFSLPCFYTRFFFFFFHHAISSCRDFRQFCFATPTMPSAAATTPIFRRVADVFAAFSRATRRLFFHQAAVRRHVAFHHGARLCCRRYFRRRHAIARARAARRGASAISARHAAACFRS